MCLLCWRWMRLRSRSMVMDTKPASRRRSATSRARAPFEKIDPAQDPLMGLAHGVGSMRLRGEPQHDPLHEPDQPPDRIVRDEIPVDHEKPSAGPEERMPFPERCL